MSNGAVLGKTPDDAPPLENGGSPNGHAAPAADVPAQPEKRKPLISWKLMSDRSTSVELALWSNTFQGPDGEFEQLSCTVSRSYRDQAGAWHKGGSWRIHDIPVLQFLLARAHAFALERRTTTEDNDVPF